MHPVSVSQNFSPWQPGMPELVLYFVATFSLVGIILFLTAWLGEKKPGIEKQRPYECGIIPTGTSRFHHPVPFYLVAVFFLVFDVEAAFIFAWAIAVKALGWSGYLKILFFIIVLLFSLGYVWKKGALDWGNAK